MTVQLVPAAPEDLSTCAEMMRTSDPWKYFGYSYAECLEVLQAPDLGIVVATADGKVVGFLASMARGISVEPLIEYVCVASHMRGRGVGTSLVLDFLEREREADNVYLFVSDRNFRAIALYDRLGFRQVGAIVGFNFPGETELLMCLHRRPRRRHRGD